MLIDYCGNLLFGQHRGENLRVIDTRYLTWMRDFMEGLDQRERYKLQVEIRNRGISDNGWSHTYNQEPFAELPHGVTQEFLIKIVSAGRHALARRYHPDVGGDHELMAQINAAADYLEIQARLLEGGNG